ncbi:rano class II histocompatibility antigen, A beta chain-like isoform X1 [Lates japonicus]|uniref:Rano class II histocompatibility antigen, A beta chain-like isoform X1 n=1 Tax=Lates japonicus TaxID=270547 RepID=A0AAD3N8K5_LATJO|nr:rano class II histocompatibility antigen, A beta chain-like isoform X1 [Lates japonicus]
MEYNSTRGNWTGFTAYALLKAKTFNGDPYDGLLRAFEKKILCIDNRNFIQTGVNRGAVTPTVKLNSVKQPGGGHPAILVCSAYNFYPKQIQVTWLRNGQEVTSAVSSSDAMPDGDWYYQIHSYLEYTPTPGETITCMVQHFTLSEPMLQRSSVGPPPTAPDTALPRSKMSVTAASELVQLGIGPPDDIFNGVL